MASVAGARLLATLKHGSRTLMYGSNNFLLAARQGTRIGPAGEPPGIMLAGGAGIPALLLVQLVGVADAAIAVYADIRAGVLNLGVLPLLDELSEQLSQVRHAASPVSHSWVDDAKRGLRHARKMLARTRELALVLMIGASPVRRSRVLPAAL